MPNIQIGFEETNKSPDNTKEDPDSSVWNSFILEKIRKKIPPPNPLLPKSYFVEDESAMTGSLGKIFMLRRFKGADKK